jgi:protein-S-isoprenylcysteine O-methyltransferase Ste14
MTIAGNASRGPGVPFPPPLLFVAGLGASWFLGRRLDFVIDGDGAGLAQTAIGVFLMAAGLGTMIWGIATFLRARTAIYPNQPSRQCVVTGPYRFTRNPMYVGLTVAYIGGALAMNAAWPFVFLPIVLVLLSVFVIRREEAYLRREFPEAYEAYCRRVRRWI